jgi:hypothetical protein
LITERERLRKRRARERESQKRELLLAEAVGLLTARLGDRLDRFCGLFDQIDPLKLRERLREELDRLLPPVEIPPFDEAKAEQLRAKWKSRSHVGGGFRLDRIK